MLQTAQLLQQVQNHTLCSPRRLTSLMRICQYLNESKIEGDFVECGTAKGGSAAVISKFLDQKRHLWLYDSYEGMPETTEKDGEDAKEWIGKCVASVEDVQEVMNLVSTCRSKYTIKKGWFHQTFLDPLPNQIALLHCDADWYESVSIVLETLYPLVSEGGCFVLDDFGYWEGCREAFYDFCTRNQEKPLLERVELDQAYWIKGKSHNRPTIQSSIELLVKSPIEKFLEEELNI